MISDPLSAVFEAGEGSLRVTGDLSADDEKGFERALGEYMSAGHGRPVLDLSEVPYVSSIYVRHIAFAMIESRKAGRTLTVLVSRRVSRLLKLGGLDKLGDLRIAGTGDGSR